MLLCDQGPGWVIVRFTLGMIVLLWGIVLSGSTDQKRLIGQTIRQRHDLVVNSSRASLRIIHICHGIVEKIHIHSKHCEATEWLWKKGITQTTSLTGKKPTGECCWILLLLLLLFLLLLLLSLALARAWRGWMSVLLLVSTGWWWWWGWWTPATRCWRWCRSCCCWCCCCSVIRKPWRWIWWCCWKWLRWWCARGCGGWLAKRGGAARENSALERTIHTDNGGAISRGRRYLTWNGSRKRRIGVKMSMFGGWGWEGMRVSSADGEDFSRRLINVRGTVRLDFVFGLSYTFEECCGVFWIDMTAIQHVSKELNPS